VPGFSVSIKVLGMGAGAVLVTHPLPLINDLSAAREGRKRQERERWQE
jgi:hypothetical protein